MVMKTRMLPGRRAMGSPAPAVTPPSPVPRPAPQMGGLPPNKGFSMFGFNGAPDKNDAPTMWAGGSPDWAAGPGVGAPAPQPQFNPFQRPNSFSGMLDFAKHRQEARGALSGGMDSAPQWLQQSAQQYSRNPNMGGFVPRFVQRAATSWGLAPKPERQDLTTVGGPWAMRR